MYFNLSNDCYFVRGKVNGVIHHLKSGRLVELNNEEANTMEAIHKGDECDREPFLLALEEMGWGFFSEKRYHIDKYRLYSNYMLLRPDLRPPRLDCAFLQLTNEGSCSVENCQKLFCTPCRKFEGNKSCLSLSQWEKIVDNLCASGFEIFILTGGDVTKYEYLPQLMDYILNKNAKCNVVVNNYCDIQKLDIKSSLFAYICDSNYIGDFISDIADFENVTLFISDALDEKVQEDFFAQNKNVTLINVIDTAITRKKMNPCDVNKLYLRKDYDGCLNGRVYITFEGNLLPCFQNQHNTIGNLLAEDFPDLLRKLIFEYWNKPVKHDKCKSCEWVFSCPVCLYMDPARICGYDVDRGLWKDELSVPECVR